MAVTVHYEAIDGFRETKTFGCLGKARAYAQHWIGETPSIGTGYAVSDDGVGKITAEGVRVSALFPKLEGSDP